MLLLLLIFITTSLVGFIVALPACHPMLQARAVGDKQFRRRLIIGLSLVAFIMAYMGSIWYFAGNLEEGSRSWYVLGSGLEYVHRAEVQREVWLQLVLLSNDCYNDDPLICETVSNVTVSLRWAWILAALIISSAIGYSTAAFAWRFTRYDNKPKRDKSQQKSDTQYSGSL